MSSEKMEVCLHWSPPSVAYMIERRAEPLPGRVIHFSNPGKSERIHNWFAQCGHTESQMDWVLEKLREPKVVNLNASRLSLAVSLAIRSM